MNPLCSKCGATSIIRDGKFGSFYCCPNFPKCEGETLSVKDYHGYLNRNNINIKSQRMDIPNLSKIIDDCISRVVPQFRQYADECFHSNITQRDIDDFYGDDFTDF